MERDDEVKGKGNQYDFGERVYDPRIGRFFSTDPIAHTNPSVSPYVYAANNPIKFIDILGLSATEPPPPGHRGKAALYVTYTYVNGQLSGSYNSREGVIKGGKASYKGDLSVSKQVSVVHRYITVDESKSQTGYGQAPFRETITVNTESLEITFGETNWGFGLRTEPDVQGNFETYSPENAAKELKLKHENYGQESAGMNEHKIEGKLLTQIDVVIFHTENDSPKDVSLLQKSIKRELKKQFKGVYVKFSTEIVDKETARSVNYDTRYQDYEVSGEFKEDYESAKEYKQ